MEDYTKQNKQAWEYNAYDFWTANAGTPQERAENDVKNPVGMLKRYAEYFDLYFKSYKGVKVANICGSCGKKAVPLAVLGAEVTVFDISEDNRRYALETAAYAGVTIDFVVGDVLETDMAQYGGYFDVVFMEGGILHYFHDIAQFMRVMNRLLKTGGIMICSDFHPFQKIADLLQLEQPAGDYFSAEVFEGEMAHARFFPPEIRKQIPLCSYRKYTLSEIINAVIENEFVLNRFDEHPAWTNEKVPGEFTLVAYKR